MTDEVVKEETVEPVLYELKRPFWNGNKLLKRGDQEYFPKGKAPATAVEVGKESTSEEPSEKKPSEKKKSDK